MKDPEHLAEKVIRKNTVCSARGYSITVNNYKEYITDLLGLRMLVLFKDDWAVLHKNIITVFDDKLAEEPFIYIREGDNESLYKDKIHIKIKDGYRSAHYVARVEEGVCMETQVRTLYEEAWGEIDHMLRYPYNMRNPMISEYMELLNRLTGMADEMDTFIHKYMRIFEDAFRDGVETENKTYQKILDRLQSTDDLVLKADVEDIINEKSNPPAMLGRME